jgi:hypothetical protein
MEVNRMAKNGFIGLFDTDDKGWQTPVAMHKKLTLSPDLLKDQTPGTLSNMRRIY